MKKTFKKILCTLLVVVMCLTSAPLQGFVGIELFEWSFKTNAANHTGTCGDNLTWVFDSNTDVLTISGSGDMRNYDDPYSLSSSILCAPWLSYYSDIKFVVLPDGMTSIGDNTFCECLYIESLIIPNSVTSIGDSAFALCSNLRCIIIPNGVTSIGDGAFTRCDSLESIIIPDSVVSIGNSTFYGCDSIENITIPNSVETIDFYAFYNCNSLKDVYYKGTEEQWKEISIGGYNECLTGATIHFLGEGESGNPDEPDNPDEPENTGYQLNLRSDGAYSDSIAVGENIAFNAFLWENKKLLDCERAYAISFDNPGIFDVVDTEITEPSFDVTLKAIGEGTTNMTISDSETGAYVTIKLKANKPVEVLTMDEVNGLAKVCDGITTHFYDYNGLYVNNYFYNEKKDGSYNVRMRVYNKKAHYGAVVAYDENGNIHDFELIKQMHKLPTNLWSGIFDVFDWVDYAGSWVVGKDVYTDNGWTQDTFIDIDVPENGHLAITNNFNNEIVFLANMTDVAMDFAFACGDVLFKDIPAEFSWEVPDEVIHHFLKKAGDKALSKMCSDLLEEFTEGITFDNIDNIMYNMAETFKKADLDFYDILKNTINEELGYNIGEDIGLLLIPGGKQIQSVLKACDYTNTLIKIYDINNSQVSSNIVIYTPLADEYKRYSNGIRVNSETPLDPKYVLHTYLIKENDDIMVEAKPTIENLSSNYKMYDITLYKSSQAVQPNAKIKVMIPIPADYNKNNIQIYWYKEDGTLQSMNAVVQGDYAVFETDHLSYYVLIDHSHSDENHDGICDTCGYDATENCSCKCHNDGFFAKIIWKIINFFNKFLRRNQECECGFYHY